MTELNLIPEHLKENRARLLHKKILSFIAAGVLVILFFAFFIPNILITKLQEQENELKSKSGLGKAEKGNAALMDDDINNQQSYIEKVEMIKAIREVISEKIYIVEKSVSQDLKILNLSYDENELAIRGATSNYNSISDFVLRLKAVKYFENSRIISINHNQLDNSYEFQIKIIFSER